MELKNIVVDIPAYDSVSRSTYDDKAIAAAALYTDTQGLFTKVLQLAARITLVSLAESAKHSKTAIQVRLGLMRVLGSATIAHVTDLRDSTKKIEVWAYAVANGLLRVKFYEDDIEFIFVSNK